MKRFLCFSLFLILLLLMGCNNNEKIKLSDVSDPVFNWNGNNYIVTNEPIPKEELEGELGRIEKEVTVLPENHEEGYKLKEGVILYEIKGKKTSNDIDSTMAVEINGEYKVARKLSEIK